MSLLTEVSISLFNSLRIEEAKSFSLFVCVRMSSSWEIQLMETAKEELEILQAQYPNRFAYLKSDLQSFISNLREDHAPPSRASSSPLVLTQGTCTVFLVYVSLSLRRLLVVCLVYGLLIESG